MNEEDLAAYCRRKGLYREQIEAWKEVCLQANRQAFDQAKQLNGQLKEEQQRAKALEKDLQKIDVNSLELVLMYSFNKGWSVPCPKLNCKPGIQKSDLEESSNSLLHHFLSYA